MKIELTELQPERRQEFLAAMGGDVDQMAAEMQRFAESTQKFESEYADLVAMYPDEWVAYQYGELVSHGQEPDRVLEEFDSLRPEGRRGLQLRFLFRDEPIMMLNL